jgi:single-strand DNA-binding protein
MNSYNKVIITGNLTRDPENKTTKGGVEIASFSLALNRQYKNQAGESVEETSFVDCTAFGKQAELIGQYMAKGRPMLLEGRLKQDIWQTTEGKNRSKLTVICEKFHFMDSKQDGTANANDEPNATPANKSPIEDDDVPF